MKQKRKDAQSVYMTSRYERHRAFIDEVKLEAGCTDCGYDEYACALDFDHLPEFEKSFELGQATRSMKSLVGEMAKCEVVCANCHRVRTKNRR